jgi:hypothetical protein
MKIKIILTMLLIVSLFCSGTHVFASGRRLGTAAAIELTIPMGVRNVAMAGADIASVRDNEAMYWNPAGLATYTGTGASFSYLDYFADMTISYFTVARNMGQIGVLGVSLQAMNIGDIVVTTIENPEGTGEIIKPNYLTLGLTYSRAFTDRVNFGANIKFVSERIAEMSASAIAFDFGIQYVTPFNVNFGVVMRNFGGTMQFDGSAIEFDSDIPLANPNATTRKTKLDMAQHELPASLDLGVSYFYAITEEHGIKVATDYCNNNYLLDIANGGLEYCFNDMVFARVGYSDTLFPSDYPDDIDDSAFGLSFGFGFQLEINTMKAMIDYAYQEMDLFNANQYIGLSLSF